MTEKEARAIMNGSGLPYVALRAREQGAASSTADSWSRDQWKERAEAAETRVRELEIANRDLWDLRERNKDLEKQARDARSILNALKDLLAATDRVRDFGRLIAPRGQARSVIEEHEKRS